MLIAGGGGGAGSTPWGMLSVRDMQLLIQNPDTEKHYELLTGWKRSADLLIEHQWQVKNYRDNLAAVWPPEKNAASAAYIARLDELISNLTETYEAAISNHDAFAAATLSISLAQKDMDDIAREYEANELALADFTAKQQSTTSQPQPSPSPSPSGEQPPVAPGRQEELYQKAVTLLSGVSADLAQAQVNIRTPRPYKPTGYEDDAASSEMGGYVPPPIPPITPSLDSRTSESVGVGRPSTPFPVSPNVPPPVPPQTSAPQPGLVLGGAAPQAPVLSAPNVTTPSFSAGLAPVGPTILPPTSSFGPARGATATPPSSAPIGRNTLPPREVVARPGASTPGGIHVMPPGGLIGGAPGVGIAHPGSARPAPSRVNPIGGVIGGMPSSRTGSMNAAGTSSATGGAYGPTVGRSAAQSERGESARWDPDNPWQTASGVDPVVMPAPERRIDPGPAIGIS